MWFNSFLFLQNVNETFFFHWLLLYLRSRRTFLYWSDNTYQGKIIQSKVKLLLEKIYDYDYFAFKDIADWSPLKILMSKQYSLFKQEEKIIFLSFFKYFSLLVFTSSNTCKSLKPTKLIHTYATIGYIKTSIKWTSNFVVR